MKGTKYFYKGKKNILLKKNKDDNQNEIEIIKNEILRIFDVKNLSFLIGAGCSSFINKDKIEIGIPIMSGLAKDFYTNELNSEDHKILKNKLNIDITNDLFKDNLEKLLEILYSYYFVLDRQSKSVLDKDTVNDFIKKIKKFLLKKCINEENNKHYSEVVDLYKTFYRKLVYRDNNLSKTNIFTTNYDLYSEKALDELGILYCNGFSGLINRYFNPMVFNYAYAEQMELSNNKWNVIDNFIYLYKLHGSINWIESEENCHLFKVKEVQIPNEENDTVMIYPTPTKQVASFASPYSDLFREFQKKLMQEKNVLVVIGYSFSDEHINNLIYQALTIPNFRLIIFQDEEKTKIKQLIQLNDPRIWVIGGKDGDESIYYFKYIVNKLLPDIDGQEKIEKSIENILKNLVKQN